MSNINELWEKLTVPERLFVEEFARLRFAPGKASEALRRAGLAGGHNSDVATRVQAHRLVTRDNVAAVIAVLVDSALPSPQQILARRTEIAFSDVADVLAPDGSISLAAALQNGKTHLIRSIKQRPTRAGLEVTVELHDPQPSLKALETVHGLDRQRVEVDAGDKLAGLLAGLVAPWAGGSSGGGGQGEG